MHVADENDTLLRIARDKGLGVLELMVANPRIDPWLPSPGTPLILPTAFILPEAPRDGIVINLGELRLYYFSAKGRPVQTWPIGVGRLGFTTPLGETRIARKRTNPVWFPTKETRADNPALPSSVPPGPNNPMGRFALDLGWPMYSVHGTNKPAGVGRRVSRGCIRLYPEDIEKLFAQVEVGTRVTVVNQVVKLGWRGGELFIEIHPEKGQLDQLEVSGHFEPHGIPGLRHVVVAAAGPEASRLLWPVVEREERERRGIPVQITR